MMPTETLFKTTLPQDELRPALLEELLSIEPSDLRRVDIGRANLLCSLGLPGTEQINVDSSLEILNQWAEGVSVMSAESFHLMDDNHDLFQGSEPVYRMFCLTQFLKNFCRIHYVEEEREFESDAD